MVRLARPPAVSTSAMDFTTWTSAEAKYHISGGEVYRVPHSLQPPAAGLAPPSARALPSAAQASPSAMKAPPSAMKAPPSAMKAPPSAARTPLYASPPNVMTPSGGTGHQQLAAEHQLEVNQGIRNTLNALRSTLGSQGAAIRGADHAIKSQQSDLAQLCAGLTEVQTATAATSTELAALRDATAAADEAALAQVRRLHEGNEQQSRQRIAEANRRLETLAQSLAAAEER